MVRRDSLNYTIFAILLDLLGILTALSLAQRLRIALSGELSGNEYVPIPLEIFGLVMAIWIMVAFILSLYDPERNHRLTEELQGVFASSFFAVLLLAGVLYFSFREVPRSFVISFALYIVMMLASWRLVFRLVILYDRRMTFRTRRAIIVGTNDIGRQLAKAMQAHEWTGLRLMGFVTDDEPDTFEGHPVLGKISEARQIVEDKDVEEVVVVLPSNDYEKFDQLVMDLQKLSVQVRVVPNYLNLALYRATAENFSGIPLINLRDPALTSYQRLTKRAFDLIVAFCLTVLSLPVMLMVALAIRLDSPGPVIFKQRRVGENGRIFIMYKFRSMYIDAEERQIEANKNRDLHEIDHKTEDDPRITRVGRFIRRTSLDELPQFFNVLLGNMSLVGPRPEMPWLVEKYEPWQRKRFAVSPGITGWWQVNGRSEKPMHLNTEDDLYYIQNYSLLLDINILWKTLGVVARSKGAY